MFLRNTEAVNFLVKGHGVSESTPEYQFSSSAHLCDIVPHAPCLLVRMLRIFCFSWFAVTWSLCLAALMRWSHIFSSSLRSTAYWAQLDWEVGSKKLNTQQTRREIKHYFQTWTDDPNSICLFCSCSLITLFSLVIEILIKLCKIQIKNKKQLWVFSCLKVYF